MQRAGAGVGPRALVRTQRALARARRSFAEDGPLLLFCVGLVTLGTWLRVVDLGFPRSLTFDEHHFVLNARNYIRHAHDWNDHPPLGKLLMVPWMLLLGDDSTSFRMAALVFGLATIPMARALADAVYRDRRAGWLAAGFVAADGFLISYSRAALLDGIQTMLVLLTAWLAVTARSWTRIAVAAVVIGLAANVKENGFALGLPVALLCLTRRQPVRRIAMLALAPVSYTATFCFGLWMARDPHTVADAWRTTFKFLHDHHSAQSFDNPLTSHWYTWFLPLRPITMSYERAGKYFVRSQSTLGNLALWWAAAIALVAAAALTARALYVCVKARSARAHVGRTSRGTVVLFSFAMTLLAPWIIGSQDSYIYHYLPIYTLLLLMLAGFAAHAYRSRRIPVLAYVSVVTLVSAYYAPVWAKLPLTPTAFEARLVFPRWR